ncbi:MAG: hypothetical protein ACTSVL_02365 [Promethearchaeota archaeon]
MKIQFEKILKSEVFKKGIIKKAVVARADGKIVYISKNWKLKPSDIKQCISSWHSKVQFVELQETKYSCLRNELDFFSGVNSKKKSYLIGAISPDEEDKYYVLGYAPPKSNGRNAYIDVVRAANQMKKGGSYIESSTQLGKYSKDDVAVGGTTAVVASAPIPQVDPVLKQEINDFLQWIKDPNGLSANIQYYLDLNDPTIIAQIAKAYNGFRQVFGF